jgi:hypothetical protein
MSNYFCLNQYLLVASTDANLPAGAFKFQKGLSGASLNATVEVCDFVSDTCFPLSISVAWTASGTQTTTRTRTKFQSGWRDVHADVRDRGPARHRQRRHLRRHDQLREGHRSGFAQLVDEPHRDA